MAAGYTIAAVGAVVTITAQVAEAQTDTTADVTTFGTAVLTEATQTQGVDAASTRDSFTIDFKGALTPDPLVVTFASGLSNEDAADAIVSAINTTLTGTDGITATKGVVGADTTRINWEYNTAGVDEDTVSGAGTTDGGDTNGTLAVSVVTTSNQGAEATTTGTLDTFTIVVDGFTYTADFEGTDGLGGLSATDQAIRIAQFLNDTNN